MVTACAFDGKTPSDANFPTPHDSTPIQSPSNVCRHVFAHLRPNRKATASSPVPACMQIAKLPLPRMPTPHCTVSRHSIPDFPPRSPVPSRARSSIAAPTTASDFLQASLSKMPRSNLRLPQHPAPRHFPSRLTTIRTGDQHRDSAALSSIVSWLSVTTRCPVD